VPCPEKTGEPGREIVRQPGEKSMTGSSPDREAAWTILTDHVKNPSLIHHALAVEAVMRYIARKKGADDEMWGVIGLIHDLDYEGHPDEHLRHAPEILGRRELGGDRERRRPTGHIPR
jgi:predicted hydrolase (HD superfamily)